jgi:hypothetical protein
MLSAARRLDTEVTFWARPCIEFVACAALGLTVLGWALMWATALAIVPYVPPWVGAVMFAAGLLLIPFRRSRVGRR